MENQNQLLTLCIIREESRILLGMKKRGFGEGRWNGFGGKVQAGEDVKDAAKREVLEEARIVLKNLEEVGILNFEFEGKLGILEVHIFKGTEFDGEPKESEEMRPQWFNISEIPYDQMWPDDRCWLPLFLDNKKFKGSYLFGAGDSILKSDLKEVEKI